MLGRVRPGDSHTKRSTQTFHYNECSQDGVILSVKIMALTSKFPLLVSEELRRLDVRRQEEHRAERDDNRGNALEDEYPPPARLTGNAVHLDDRSGQQT